MLTPVVLDDGRMPWMHQRVHAAIMAGWRGGEHPGLTDLLASIKRLVGDRQAPELDELHAWRKADGTNDAGVLETFAANFPNSRFAPVARERVKDLRERATWAEVEATTSVSALAAFVRRFPDGRFADAALERIHALETGEPPRPPRPQPPPLQPMVEPTTAYRMPPPPRRGRAQTAISVPLIGAAVLGAAGLGFMIWGVLEFVSRRPATEAGQVTLEPPLVVEAPPAPALQLPPCPFAHAGGAELRVALRRRQADGSAVDAVPEGQVRQRNDQSVLGIQEGSKRVRDPRGGSALFRVCAMGA